MARKRVIYQSEALYSAKTGDTDAGNINQIHRVQDVSHSVEVARTDVNEFGRLAALSREVIEVPTVSCDFSYYVIDGHNEANGLGLTIEGFNSVDSDTNCLSGIMAENSTDAEKNYYILTVPEGEDATQSAEYTTVQEAKNGVIGIGNGYITSYGFSASVGEIPSASVSVEASNLRFDTSSSGIPNPAVDPSNGTAVGGNTVAIPKSTTGDLQAFAIRPGDITVDFGSSELQQGGALLPGMTATDATRDGKACVQSVSIDLPMSRTPLQCLGSVFPKSRELDLPITTSLTVNANLADISSGDLNSLLCGELQKRNITVTMRSRCGEDASDNVMVFGMSGAQLDSQSMSSSIGDNKSVDMTFSAQIGGPGDSENGLFISGKD
tara:strand:- start:3785 stop:4927 length:1143 start_codon:yes stop_codon:yes gene_type:complete